MPTVNLLSTTGFGYTVINFTGAQVASFLALDDISSQVDGVTATFSTLPHPGVGTKFVPTTLMVFWDGVLQSPSFATPIGPGYTQFTLGAVPPVNTQLVVRYIAA